ncbi:MAG: hypothetical protein IT449_12825 [Phycisphaerales bacterium]|nr:hypothetical protein [Phycisphaerales bacterium]
MMTTKIRRAWTKTTALIAILAFCPAASADILDDILDLVKSAKTYALAARDRATEARNNAAAARDSANEVRDNLRDSVGNLTDAMRDAIAEGVEDLQRQLEGELEGRDEFTDGPNGCSAEECQPFRARLIEILDRIELVANTVLAQSCAGEVRLDLQRERDLVANLPGRLLFPLYRSHLFDDGTLAQALQAATEDLSILVQVLQEDEAAACAFIADNEEAAEDAVEGLECKARFFKMMGKLFSALGKLPFQPDAGAWGWVGIVAKVEPGEKIGTALEGLSDSMDSLAKSAGKRIRDCVKGGNNSKLKRNQEEMMRDLDHVLANQDRLLKGQEQLQQDVRRILEILEDKPRP